MFEYKGTENFDKAKEDFAKTLKLDPDDKNSYYGETNMTSAFIVTPTGDWLPLGDNDRHFDVIKRFGFLNDFSEDEPDAHAFFKNLGYSDDDEISIEDEEAFDDIEFEYSQRAVFHALKNGVLRIRLFKAGEMNRSGQTILIAGDINRITNNIIETAFIKFAVPNTTTLSIENTKGNEIFKGTYDNFIIFRTNK
jgi:tetratricopeptide (TPR) repeat protein